MSTAMGGKGKQVGGKKPKQVGGKKPKETTVPMKCPACKERLFMSLTLSTKHVQECVKLHEQRTKDKRRIEAANAQAGQRGRR